MTQTIINQEGTDPRKEAKAFVEKTLAYMGTIQETFTENEQLRLWVEAMESETAAAGIHFHFYILLVIPLLRFR